MEKSILEYNLVAAVGTMSEFVSVMAQLVRGFLCKNNEYMLVIKVGQSPLLIGYSVSPIKLLQGN